MKCNSCGKGQRSLNDKLQKTVEDAKRYSQEKNKEVIVFATRTGFRFEEFKPTYKGPYIYKISPQSP